MAKVTVFHVHKMIVHESESRESLDERIFTRVTPTMSAIIDDMARQSGINRSTWLRQVVNRAVMEATEGQA